MQMNNWQLQNGLNSKVINNLIRIEFKILNKNTPNIISCKYRLILIRSIFIFFKEIMVISLNRKKSYGIYLV